MTQRQWNAAAFAEQGYIVVAPNPTGSVGFGLEHTESRFPVRQEILNMSEPSFRRLD